MPLKIGFFAPGDYHDPTINYSGPTLGLGFIASILKAEFPDADIFLEIDPEVLIQKKPDIVGISAFTYAYGMAIEGSKKIRNALGPDTPIILGGPHITALPSNLHPSMDVGVLGEGEHIMVDLVRHFHEKKWHPEAFKDIDSIVFWDHDKKLNYSTAAKRIHDLDALPLPDRQIMEAYWPDKNETLKWMPTLSTARGCPFTCGFCMYSKTASLVRYHSADRVMQDLEDILKQFPDITHIRITDDLFVTKKARLRELAARIREKKYHQKFTFGCMAKASFFDEEYCEILKSMNIAVIAFGFESASDNVLHYLKDTQSSSAKNQRALDLCRKHGIHVGGYFIVGAPPETEMDLAKTYWFISKNNPCMPVAGIFPLIATPGTAVWRTASERGLIDDTYDQWSSFSYHSLETKEYLHLNENYSFDRFHEIHQTHFRPIKQRSSFHLSFMSAYRHLLITYYREIVYPKIKPWVKNLNVFEISRGDLSIQHLLEDDCHLTTHFWTEPLPESWEGTDLIVLSHTLEKFGFNSPQWRAVESFSGPILLTIENAATWARLVSMLQGKPPHSKSLEQFLSFYHFSLENLKKELKTRGYQIEATLPHHLPQGDSDYVHSILDPFSDLVATREMDFESYPMIMHIKKSFATSNLIDFCRDYLPIDNFAKDANIYSYSLLIKKIN